MIASKIEVRKLIGKKEPAFTVFHDVIISFENESVHESNTKVLSIYRSDSSRDHILDIYHPVLIGIHKNWMIIHGYMPILDQTAFEPVEIDINGLH